jgi:two-component system, NtrC family, nitrogen regulation response regulator GlnG
MRRTASAIPTSEHDPSLVALTSPPVPILTVLAHPDPERLGARVSLIELRAGRALELSRSTPRFSRPGSRELSCLAEPALSRTPLGLCAGSSPGSVRLLRGASTMAVKVDGVALRRQLEISATQIAKGAVLLLAGRVALLLHH